MLVAERRQTSRGQILYYLKAIHQDTNQVIGYVEDVSADGIMLRSKDPIESGKIFSLKLMIPSVLGQSQRYVECSVESLWTRFDYGQEIFFSGFRIQKASPMFSEVMTSLYEQCGFKYY